MIKVVSFDMDGTLISPLFADNVWNLGLTQAVADHKGWKLEYARDHVVGILTYLGNKDLRWYDLQYWLDFFEVPMDKETLVGLFRDDIKIYPEVLDVLDQLDVPLIITSNAARVFINTGLENILPLFCRSYSTVDDFGDIKSAASYSSICADLKVDPSEVLHVGDNFTLDYLVPQEIGMNSFFVDRAKNDLSGVFDEIYKIE